MKETAKVLVPFHVAMVELCVRLKINMTDEDAPPKTFVCGLKLWLRQWLRECMVSLEALASQD